MEDPGVWRVLRTRIQRKRKEGEEGENEEEEEHGRGAFLLGRPQEEKGRSPTPSYASKPTSARGSGMFNLNEAFDQLRRKVPTFAYEKRLSDRDSTPGHCVHLLS